MVTDRITKYRIILACLISPTLVVPVQCCCVNSDYFNYPQYPTTLMAPYQPYMGRKSSLKIHIKHRILLDEEFLHFLTVIDESIGCWKAHINSRWAGESFWICKFYGKLRELLSLFSKTFSEVLASFFLFGPCSINACLNEKQGTAPPYTGIVPGSWQGQMVPPIWWLWERRSSTKCAKIPGIWDYICSLSS